MSSSKPRNDKDEASSKNMDKHPGGPLQRKGKSADSWNEAVGSSLEIIPQTVLPTKRTILRRYRHLRVINASASTNEMANCISNEVAQIWNQARVPCCNIELLRQKVKSVINWWNKSSKDPPAKRLEPQFQETLDQLLDIAVKPKGRYNEEKGHEYLKAEMKKRGKAKATGFENTLSDQQDWEDDMDFYVDQKQSRKKHMEGVDRLLTRKEKRKQMNQSSSTNFEETVETHTEQRDEPSANEPDDDEDIDFVPTVRKTKKDDSTTLDLPPDSIKQLAPLALRLGLSVRQQLAYHSGVIKVGGGSVKQTKISVATVQRQRSQGIDDKCVSIRKSFLENLPCRMVLHWDGKKITYAKKKKKDDRLCIIGSFPGITEQNGELQSDQFFGAPLVKNGSGLVCAQTVAETITEWNIPGSIIIGMSWDTTASSTGHNLGAAVLFEAKLMHAILWLACRHHMGELHIKHPDI